MDMHANDIVRDSEVSSTKSALAGRVAEIIAGGRDRDPSDLAREIEALISDSYQRRVDDWMMPCFGAEITLSKAERNSRFIEEALELVQACGMSAGQAHTLVDYVYGRPIGEIGQEVGGVEVTLAALCTAHGISKAEAGEAELARVWPKIEKIRQKHASKPAEVIGDGAGTRSADQATTLDPLRAGLRVRFRYRNWRGEEANRHVEIRGLWYGATEWHKKPQWLLKAVDLDKNEPRDFAVRDILGPANDSNAPVKAG